MNYYTCTSIEKWNLLMNNVVLSYFDTPELTPSEIAHSIRELGEDLLERGETVDCMLVLAGPRPPALKNDNNIKIGKVSSMETHVRHPDEKWWITLVFDPYTLGLPHYTMSNLEFAEQVCNTLASHIEQLEQIEDILYLPEKWNTSFAHTGFEVFVQTESPRIAMAPPSYNDELDETSFSVA